MCRVEPGEFYKQKQLSDFNIHVHTAHQIRKSMKL